MKKIWMILLAAVLLMGAAVPASSAEDGSTAAPKAGDRVASLDEGALEKAGYRFVDDRDSQIIYTWPYTLKEYYQTSESAYQSTLTFQAGQVSATILYQFTGTYIAVAFAETYYAAEVIISIDGEVKGSATPHHAEAPKEGAGDSKIIFVQDDLAPGQHVIQISHRTAHTTGEDNIKGDGNAYYDNDAMFDCFIVRAEQIGAPEKVTQGDAVSLYTDDILAELGLKVIDNTDEEILYTWPYDIESALVPANTAYGGSLQSNCGQVSGTISYEFEGTYFAAAFAETYYACTIFIDIDGEIVGEITPHVNIKSQNPDAPYQSKILFVKDDLTPGDHFVTITHEAAYTTGEDNIKEDGNAYYDNNAMFDCFLVQAEPTPPTAKPEATATPVPSERPTSAPSEAPTSAVNATVPPTAETSNDIPWVLLAAALVLVTAAAVAAVVFIRKKKKSKDQKN